ncbi:FG-GAP and VCBS repeat-containing protein [Streptomyces cylindrosporus]|uniref:VCBS repeat-containing protein n=1 Tax=Streptomyces cylindrosporus TaxID=2927583 RepID=A0ABS9YED1_9ACTN|nr:FG-GAP and VCBS repeat-containing protein [Streptomyces cylindrosporus]MCI3274961.1 VCBS repeat-containing protein [Streptomyces cylindrosporus]
MTIRTGTGAGLLAAALLSATLTPLALAAPASAAAAKYADDFNGDGYRDLVLGDRTAAVGGRAEAGAVVVMWGTASGLDSATRKVYTQNSPGVEGSAEAGDHFGAKVTTADLNKDGYADVVVTSPGEDSGSRHGMFSVLWGSKSGLTKGSSYTMGGDDVFAKDIAVGDFDADGKPDVVAVGDNYVWFMRGPFTKSGSRGTATNLDPVDGEDISPELVVSGKVTKDSTADFAVVGYDAATRSHRVWFYRGSGSGPVRPPKKYGLPASTEITGSSAVIADFDKNGYGDLAVGVSRSGKGGAVHLLKGTSTGFGTTVKSLSQDTAGVPGVRESGDYFGYDVSAGDTNGDGYPDLAVGVPLETLGSEFWRAGAVTVLRGGASGLTGTNSRQYDYTTSGVERPADESDSWFGASVLLRDYNRDGRAELVAAAPEIGRLHFFPGTSSGPTGAGSSTLTVKQLGLGTRTFFGAALAD